MMKKLGKSSEAKGDLRMFRGVSFDDWMNVFMQVSGCFTDHCLSNTEFIR